MNRKNKKRFFIEVLVTLVFFVLPSCVFSQERNDQLQVKNESAANPLIATVNVRNVSFEKKEGKFIISFQIENEQLIQPEVRFGIVLNKIEKGELIEVDRKIFEDVLAIGDHQIIRKEIEYQPPSFSKGLHEIDLEIRTQDGLLLDYVPVTKTELLGNDQKIEIEEEKCAWFNPGKNAEFSFREGSFFENKDIIFLRCPILNKYEGFISAKPALVLRENSPYGQIISQTEYPETSLNSQEEKYVELRIAALEGIDKKAISATLYFTKNDKIISPVSEGSLFAQSKSRENAWLLNVRFQKDSYFSGEKAEITVNWDSFLVNENGSEVPILEVPAEIELVSQSGVSCIKSSEKSSKSLIREAGQYESKLKIDINKDCRNFTLGLSLLDSQGNKIADGRYGTAPQKIQAKVLDQITKVFIKYKLGIIIGFAVLNLLIIFWFLLKWIKRKIAYRNYIIPIVPLIFAIHFGLATNAEANTFYDPGNQLIYNLSGDKESYFVNNAEDKKYIVRSSVQRNYYQKQNELSSRFHVSVQLKAPGLEEESVDQSGWITIIENIQLNYSEISGAEIEADTPRIQEYDSNSGPTIKGFLNGSPISNGAELAKLNLNLRENGECGKLEFVNEKPDKTKACAYGVPNYSDDHRKLEYADPDGKIRWKCSNVNGNQDANCEGTIRLDGKCGEADGKAICDVVKYSSSAQSLYGDYPLYCDNSEWIIGDQKKLETWGQVPENFSFDASKKGKEWICKGTNGGTDANCEILPGRKAACGPANGQLAKDIPQAGLCSSGSPSGVYRTQNTLDRANGKRTEKWEWTCDFSEMNISFGCAVDCSAPVLIEEKKPDQVPENGNP